MVEARVNLTTASRVAYTWSIGRLRFLPAYAPTYPGLCISPAQAKEIADKMIGAHLITKQTGSAGRICNAVSFALMTLEVCFFFLPLKNLGHVSGAPHTCS